MKSKKNVPSVSITNTIAEANGDWQSSDYFISADEYLSGTMEIFRPDYYALFICVEGELRAIINKKNITLRPYCFISTSPETVVQVISISSNCKGRFLFFTKSFLLSNIISPSLLDAFHYLIERVGFCLPLNVHDTAVLLQLYEILKEKRGEGNSAFHIEIIRSLFFTFLYEAAAIYKKNVTGVPHKISREMELHQKFSELLIVHDKEEHHLKFYADSLFITPQYLIHAIKNACGQTPGQLIDEAIVAEAKLLLSNKDMSIKLISTALHFSSQAAFSKFFKKHAGFSPSLYHERLIH